MLGLSAQNKSWRRSFCKFYVLGAISGERLLTMQLQCSLIVILLLCLQLQDGESIRLPQLPGFSWGRKACTDFHSKSQSGSVTLNADGDFQFSSDASEGKKTTTKRRQSLFIYIDGVCVPMCSTYVLFLPLFVTFCSFVPTHSPSLLPLLCPHQKNSPPHV